MTNADNTSNAFHKFCFIFGSFAETSPKLRSPDSDIDVLFRNMDTCEVRSLLKKKYPKLPTNIKIDMIPAEVKNNEIRNVQCYWQNIKPLELHVHGDVKYTFVGEGEKNFSCCARDPKKQNLIDYLKSPLINLTKNRNLSHIIDKHYGSKNFLDAISSLPHDDQQLFSKLHESKWELTDQCTKMLRPKFII